MRTSEESVSEIVEVDGNIDLLPFIETATALVDEVEAADTNGVLSSTRLELIERWLAAHFYAMRDPRAVSERAGPVGATYQSKVDLGFAASHYGQQAMALDSTGKLKALSDPTKGRKRAASLFWAGTEAE